jgi:hypothetical protein
MKIEKNYTFERDEALSRIQALTDYWKRHGVVSDWRDNSVKISGRIKGIKLNASVTVDDKRLYGEVKVGFLAEKLGGSQYVERKLGEYLDPNTSVEALQEKARS